MNDIPEHHPAYEKTQAEEDLPQLDGPPTGTEILIVDADGEPALDLTGVDPKKDAGDRKDPMHLIPYEAEAAVARAMKTGADKYGPFNWRHNHVKMSTYVAAMRRHIGEWQEGRDEDPESGEHPLTHVAASCLIILDAIRHGCVEDDRP